MEMGRKENMRAKSFCVTEGEGEGHRDPVNTNTTSGRGGGGEARNKNQDCQSCTSFFAVYALHKQEYRSGMSFGMSKQIFEASI